MATALAQAKKDNNRVEIEALRSETGTYFANPDGKTVHAELSSTPIRVKKDGAWQPIDTRLIEKDGVLQPKASLGDLTLSAGRGTDAVTYTDAQGKASIVAPATLPKPVVKDNTATYPDAYGPDADLVVTVTPSGFRNDVVIRERPAKELKLRVPMRLPKGLKLGEGADKTPGVLDAKGKEVTDLSSATILDAAAMSSPDQGLVGKASTAVDGDSLVLTAPSDFLADPAVTYPVTVTAASEDWVGTGIAGDTHVSNVRPSGRDNATLQWLLAGRSHSGTQTHRSYIRFNIKGTPLEGGTVENGDLRLHNYNSHTCDDEASAGIVAHRITTPWTVDTLTWSNQPSVTVSGQVGNRAAYSSQIPCPEGEGELYYSIEQMVQAWMNGEPDEGVQLISPTETVAQNWRYYRSDEYGGYDTYPFTPRGPVLIIKYTPKPSAPKVQGFFIPGPSDGTPPTDEEIADHLTDRTDPPTLPLLNEEQALALREDSDEAVVQDARFGFYPVEEITREDWLDTLDPDQEVFEPEPETIPPVVVATDPLPDANDVPVSAALQVTFDEPIADPVFVVKNTAGAVVEGQTNFQGTQASFVPAQPLSVSTKYTAEISGAVDVDGNAMAAPHSWSFTTAAFMPVEGLVAAYGMNEGTGTSVGDSSGKGNSGTATSTSWVNGKYGKALSLSGTSGSWVTVPHSSSLRLTNGMTLSAWVNPNNLSSYRTIVMKDHASGSAYGLYASNSTVPSAWMYRPNTGQHAIIDGTTALPLNTWNHVAVTYDGATARLYVNGTQAREIPMNGDLADDDGALHIGGNTRWGEFFSGLIDEVRIYNRAQTSQQIQTDMNTPVGLSPPSQATTQTNQARAHTSASTDKSGATPNTPTGSQAVQAGNPFPYNRIEKQIDCQLNRPERHNLWRWIKNSFNVCYTGLIGERVTVNDIPTGIKWSARISIVVHTYVGHDNLNTAARGEPGIHSRQIKAWIKVDQFYPGGFENAGGRPFSVHLNNTSSCTSDKPQGLSDTVADWIQGPDRVIILTSPAASFPGPEHRGFCGIIPSVYYPETEPPAKRVGMLDNERLEFRCDSSPDIKNYTGGCVVWSSRPVWHLDGNQEATKQTAAHIWKALYDQQNTDTKYPGQTKKIPGRINLLDRGCKSQVGCLTRSAEDRKQRGTIPFNNYQASKRECKKLKTPPNVTKRSCDEFPFASTHQGTAYAGINYSVAIVECTDNTTAGALLGAWYHRERILEKDPFWVDTTKEGDPVPPNVTPPDSAEPPIACDP
ncbi:LamG-like jellyroll fold domain-containing protein [Nonomuraea sp. B19D2]|uniref:LamG-like jellyroll fold domain-containing protein n=1 Tax=Nonomuraea sp. B19D2 TaxID=3159561 RepID=UPI0032DAC649